MNILINIKNLLISPRFISFYWGAGITVVVGFIALISEALPNLGMPEIASTLIVLALAQITKALDNFRKGKEMGFAPKR